MTKVENITTTKKLKRDKIVFLGVIHIYYILLTIILLRGLGSLPLFSVSSLSLSRSSVEPPRVPTYNVILLE